MMRLSDADADVCVESDDEQLRKLGYAPVLRRAWSGFAALCIVLSSMSILTSVAASFDVALTYGGPVVAVWGWIFVSAVVLCVSLNMAELSSAFPTSGGMYYWTFRLTGAKHCHFASWVAGWLNLIAQLSGNAAQNALLADLMMTIASMAAAYRGLEAVEWTPGMIYGLYVGSCFVSALANSLGDRVNILMNEFGGCLNVVGAVVLTVMLPLVATQRQPASYVFGHFEAAQAEAVGIRNPIYIFVLGLLLPAWAYTGLDSAEYLSEETIGATRRQPRAIILGCLSMFVLGLALVISLLFAMPSLEAAIDPESPAGGYAMAQIMYDVFVQRTGSPFWGIILFAVFPFLSVWTCSSSSYTYAARICFAYGRDGLMPFSKFFGTFNYTTRTPLNALWGTTVISLLLGLPLLGSSVAFESLLSLSTIALFILYAGPATLRITVGRKLFQPGAFKLGWWAYPCGIVSTCWWIATIIIFSLPIELPVTLDNFNYAPVTLVGVLVLSAAWYHLPRIGAKHRYKGPSFDMQAFEAAMLQGQVEQGQRAVGAGKGVRS